MHEVFNDHVEANGTIDPQTGFGPIVWDSWETNWTGVEVVDETRDKELLTMVLMLFTRGETWRPFRGWVRLESY